MRVLSESRAEHFGASLATHLARHFPDFARGLGAAGVESFVIATRAKATSYGYESARDVTRILNLCAVFGLDFDEQPANAWMRTILTGTSVTSASERLRILTATCLQRADVDAHNARAKASLPAPPALPAWLS